MVKVSFEWNNFQWELTAIQRLPLLWLPCEVRKRKWTKYARVEPCEYRIGSLSLTWSSVRVRNGIYCVGDAVITSMDMYILIVPASCGQTFSLCLEGSTMGAWRDGSESIGILVWNGESVVGMKQLPMGIDGDSAFAAAVNSMCCTKAEVNEVCTSGAIRI